MRALLGLVIGMGVLIVAGVAVVVVTIANRMGASTRLTHDLVLSEPAGTRITGVAGAGGSLAVLLQGGGQDRVVLVDPAHATIAGRITLNEFPAAKAQPPGAP
jgi:hypothetical protein